MKNNYIDNTIEAILKAFEDKNMENTEQYKRLKIIEGRRVKEKNNE
jgi:hypothetical protein